MKIRKENLGKRFFGKGMITVCLLLALAMVFPSNAEAAKLNKKSVTLLKGKTVTLQMKGTKKKAVWKMSRKGVVRFTAKKNTSVKVQAVRIGETTVSAKIGKKTYKCKVRVVDPKLNSRKVNLKVGEAKILKVQSGTGTIKWQTNSPAVASVIKGKVTAKKAGEAKITAVCNGKTMVCTVKVKGKAPAKNEGNNSTQPTQPQGKKVWVVTKETYTEYIPVYDIEYGIQCTKCETIFSYKEYGKVGAGEAYDEHEKQHILNEEPCGYRTIVIKEVLIDTKIIRHSEEGYWKYV